ncbi:oxidation resistance protein 1-like protein [Tanacetum coccineum]
MTSSPLNFRNSILVTLLNCMLFIPFCCSACCLSLFFVTAVFLIFSVNFSISSRISAAVVAALYAALPILSQGKKWALLCSTWRHSISLSTLYRRSSLCSRLSLLVVGDTKGVAFGGLVEAPLRPSTKKRYQGSNNTFVFTNASGYPVIFRPTCANRYFTLCSTVYLALGGGSHFALYLDSDLLIVKTLVDCDGC